MNKDPKGKEIFHAVTEAYSVLGDDRQRCVSVLLVVKYADSLRTRREYDRSLGGNSVRDLGLHSHSQWTYETRRRRGATHAWASTRPSGGPYGSRQQFHPGFRRQQEAKANTHGERDPFLSENAQKAARRRPQDTGDMEADNVQRESAFWRAVQVIAVLIMVATVGGWSAPTS